MASAFIMANCTIVGEVWLMLETTPRTLKIMALSTIFDLPKYPFRFMSR